MQTSCSRSVTGLRELLEKLHGIARTACTNMSHIAKTEADLTKALRIEKERATKLEAELLEYKAKYQAVYNEHKSLKVEYETTAKSLTTLQAQFQRLQSEYEALKLEHKPCADTAAGLRKQVKDLSLSLSTTQEDLRVALDGFEAAQAEHEPCAKTIADLKARVAALEGELEAAKRDHAPCAVIIADLRKEIQVCEAAACFTRPACAMLHHPETHPAAT